MDVDEDMKKLSVSEKSCNGEIQPAGPGDAGASPAPAAVKDSGQAVSASVAPEMEAQQTTTDSDVTENATGADMNLATRVDSRGSDSLAKCRQNMLESLSQTEAHFKHQQRGEPDLTAAEKISIAADLLDNKPSVFLSRYGKYLRAEDLVCFDKLKDDYVINFHLQEIRKRLDDKKNTVKIRNRRYEAMKQLVTAGDYFSDEEMKYRDPLLYEQMVGQFLTEDDYRRMVDKSDLHFSSILLSHMDMQENNAIYYMQKDLEAKQSSEMEVDDDDDDAETEEEESDLDDDELPGNKIAAAEKLLLRDEFVNMMKERFLAGQDETFDYSTVDGNVEYDSLDQRERDEQEKYFDDDDEEDVHQADDMDTLCEPDAAKLSDRCHPGAAEKNSDSCESGSEQIKPSKTGSNRSESSQLSCDPERAKTCAGTVT